jgi:hypothetical protein
MKPDRHESKLITATIAFAGGLFFMILVILGHFWRGW